MKTLLLLLLALTLTVGSHTAKAITYPPDYIRYVVFFNPSADFTNYQYPQIKRLRNLGVVFKLEQASTHPGDVAKYHITTIPTYSARYTDANGITTEEFRLVGDQTDAALLQGWAKLQTY